MLRAFMCPAGPEQMMADANFAVAQEPPWSLWRDNALTQLAEAHLCAGDEDEAAAAFAEASAAASALGKTDAIVSGEAALAQFAMDRGNWAEATAHLELAWATIDERRLHDYVVSALAYAGSARLAMHRGDLNEAERQLTRAMRARPACTFTQPSVAVRLRLQLARLYFAMSDVTTARHLLREIDDVFLRRPALGVLAEKVSEFRRVLTSSTKGRMAGASPLTPAELRLLPYLQTHLTYRDIGERLFVSRNTVSTEVSSIFRKLGVSSRSEAVRQATSIGLLGG
jgi:LuxR family maltose regulon positive regulatory protein